MKTSPLFYFAPFFFALIGWLIAKLTVSVYISIIVKRKAQIGTAIGNYATQQFSFDGIEQTLTEPAAIEKILPFAEQHIDEFLRKKLPASMPVLAIFISDKLVTEMKAIFMNELKDLFPVIIQQYLTNVKKNINISNIISTKFNTISLNELSEILKKQLKVVELACATTGFMCGCFYISLTLLA